MTPTLTDDSHMWHHKQGDRNMYTNTDYSGIFFSTTDTFTAPSLWTGGHTITNFNTNSAIVNYQDSLDEAVFEPLKNAQGSLKHPVDIYRSTDGLEFEIACTGIDKKDIRVHTAGNLLSVIYRKADPESDNKDRECLYKSLKKRDFSLHWKIDTKYDLAKTSAEFKNGLLYLNIPFSKKQKSTDVEIK